MKMIEHVSYVVGIGWGPEEVSRAEHKSKTNIIGDSVVAPASAKINTIWATRAFGCPYDRTTS